MRLINLAAVAGLALGSSLAHAQSGGPTPSRSSESYKSWVVECTNAAPPPAEEKTVTKDAKKAPIPAKSTCEAAQIFRNRKTGSEIARVVFAIDPKGGGHIVAGLRTVADVSFERNPGLTDGDVVIVNGKFTRCVGGACFGLLEIDEKKLARLISAAAPEFRFPIASGQQLRIKLEIAGLEDALAVLKARQ